MSEYQRFMILKTITDEVNSQHYNCTIMFTSQTVKKKRSQKFQKLAKTSVAINALIQI